MDCFCEAEIGFKNVRKGIYLVDVYRINNNGPAVCLVGVNRRRAAPPSPDCPARNASKARPRRVWRGFCHHDRSCGIQGNLLLLNMFRGVSTVLTLNVSSRLPPSLYLMTVPHLRDGHGLQKP